MASTNFVGEVKPPNIILIVLDTARFDIIDRGINDGSLPNLANFSRDANVFDRAYSPSPWTTPSHVSLFTGLYPSSHGVHTDFYTKETNEPIMVKYRKIKKNNLPEILKKKGYRTYGIVANPNLSPVFGFDRGFDNFEYVDENDQLRNFISEQVLKISQKESVDYEKIRGLVSNFDFSKFLNFVIKSRKLSILPSLLKLYRRIQTYSKLLDFPAKKSGNLIVQKVENSDLLSPFFLFLNFMEMHEPYATKIKRGKMKFTGQREILLDLAEKKRIPIKLIKSDYSAYKGAAVTLDGYLCDIVKSLKSRGIYDDSIIIVTSDHGQSFEEKGFYGHGFFLYEELIHIPLIVKMPKQEKITQKRGFQSLINIFKFIVEGMNGSFDGSSLTSSEVFSECYGINHDYRKLFEDDSSIVGAITKHDCYRKALLKDDFKFVINTTTSKVEECLDLGKRDSKSPTVNKIQLEYALKSLSRLKDWGSLSNSIEINEIESVYELQPVFPRE